MGAPIPRNPSKESGDYDKQIADLKRQIAYIMELIGKGSSVDMNAIGRKFVSIKFFETLFAVHGRSEEEPETEETEEEEESEATEESEQDSSDIIRPNTIAEVESIEAKAGFWTNYYVDALGNGGSSEQGEGGGIGALYECVDVKRDGDKVYGAAAGTVLMYGSDNKWYASNVSLDLSSYAKMSWVQQQAYLTKGIADTYYLGLHATADAATKLATARTLWGQSFDGTQNVSGNMSSVGNISFDVSGRNIGGIAYFDTTNSRLGIGGAPGAYKLDVSGIIHVTTGLISDGYVDALSDIRKKDVIKDFDLDIDKIALARLIQFTWKDGHNKDIHAGCIAQEWQKILPEAVHESADGTLSMDYGVIGMASSVSLARKVVKQQKEIDDLKSRLEKIEKLLEERL